MTRIGRLIIDSLSDDLLKKEYLNVEGKNKFTGHCYVASEAYFYLSKELNNEDLRVYHVKHENTTHWFLRDSYDDIIDLTYLQFKTLPIYEKARRGFFLTKKPSKRCQTLLKRVYDKIYKDQELRSKLFMRC